MTFEIGNLLIGAMLLVCCTLWAVNIVHLHALRRFSQRLDRLEDLLGVKHGKER